MNTIVKEKTNWGEQIHHLGKIFEKRAFENDRTGNFVFENYEQLKEHRFFSAAIPKKFGGGGVSHAEMCQIIRIMGQYCGSTALAFSMHQHLVAATLWKYNHKAKGADFLRGVASDEQVLISTGARDWLGSNGEMTKVKGGYLFDAKKHFASQSVAGDVAVTSSPYVDQEGNRLVLHFSVPMNTSGVSLLDDWDVMGMRATGSQTIVFKQVFIPNSAITLERPRDEFHPVWSVVLTVAMPLIMSAYVGLADRAFDIALEKGKKYRRNSSFMSILVGRMYNQLLTAQTAWQAMFQLTDNFKFRPTEEKTISILTHKTIVGEATKKTVEYAMEAIGGQSFYRSNLLERIFRDVQASPFHPLPKWEQYEFTGKRILESYQPKVMASRNEVLTA